MTQLRHQHVWAFLAVLWLASCTTDLPQDTVADASATETVSDAPVSDLSLVFDIEGVPFAGELPTELNYVSDIAIENGPHGAAKVVRVGDSFTVHITKELVSLSDLKSDLAENGLFDVVFFDEGDASFFYELVLPDGRSAGHHYVRLLTDDRGATYVMRTGDERQHGYFVTQLASRTLNSMKIAS